MAPDNEGFSRRDLLRGAGALALGATSLAHADPYGLPPLVSPERAELDPQTKPVGYAILGLGNYALNLIMPNMAACKLSKPVAVISGSDEKANQIADKYGIPRSSAYTYDTMDKIKDNPEIEVVYVITPPTTHKEFTLRALRLGKHVCCEKPFAGTSADCRAMIAEAKKLNKHLQVGYRCHYQPHNLRAIQACRNELGILRSIVSEHGFNMPGGTWRTRKVLAGGGSLWDIGIYALNAAIYLAGENPTEVVAQGHNLPEPRFADIDDTVHFQLKFPSGVHASCSSSYSFAGANNYRVLGTRGTLVADPATGYSGHRLVINGREAQVENVNHFAAQMDDLSRCIREGGTVKTPGEMGLRDILILEAVLESMRTHKAIPLSKLS